MHSPTPMGNSACQRINKKGVSCHRHESPLIDSRKMISAQSANLYPLDAFRRRWDQSCDILCFWVVILVWSNAEIDVASSTDRRRDETEPATDLKFNTTLSRSFLYRSQFTRRILRHSMHLWVGKMTSSALVCLLRCYQLLRHGKTDVVLPDDWKNAQPAADPKSNTILLFFHRSVIRWSTDSPKPISGHSAKLTQLDPFLYIGKITSWGFPCLSAG